MNQEKSKIVLLIPKQKVQEKILNRNLNQKNSNIKPYREENQLIIELKVLKKISRKNIFQLIN